MTGLSAKAKKQQELLLEINRTLYDKYGDCHCALKYQTPFQLLVAVILSAQCTDIRVNIVTSTLFEKYPDAEAFANAEPAELEEAIKPAGLFRNKAKSIINAAKDIVNKHAGKVPMTMQELTHLAGVGRKTANVILGDAFGVPGFPVDTHVKRVLNRLGAVNSEVPEKIEAEVNKLVPDEYWTNFSHIIILHGRDTCNARKPDCENCTLNKICKYYRKNAA
jgi:endonuclease-3